MNLHLTIPPSSPLADRATLRVIDDGSTELIVDGEVWAVFSAPDRMYLDEAIVRLGVAKKCVRTRLAAAGIPAMMDVKKVGRPPVYFDRAAVMRYISERAREAREEAERLESAVPKQGEQL